MRRSALQRKQRTGKNGQLQSRSLSYILVSTMRRGQDPPLVETRKDTNRYLEHRLPVPVETISHSRKRALVHHIPAREILILVKECFPRFTEKLPEKFWYCSIVLMSFKTTATMSWFYWKKCHSSTAETETTMESIVVEIVTRFCVVMVARTFWSTVMWSRWDTDSRQDLTCSSAQCNFSTITIWCNHMYNTVEDFF